MTSPGRMGSYRISLLRRQATVRLSARFPVVGVAASPSRVDGYPGTVTCYPHTTRLPRIITHSVRPRCMGSFQPAQEHLINVSTPARASTLTLRSATGSGGSDIPTVAGDSVAASILSRIVAFSAGSVRDIHLLWGVDRRSCDFVSCCKGHYRLQVLR